MNSIVDVDWLKVHLNDSNLILLDASAATASGKVSDLDAIKIVGARSFDLKNVFSDANSKFPNTLPTPVNFQEACQNLGINSNSKVVVYDNLGVYWSPRVWWMFNAMGHKDIAVLDGGLPEWVAQGFPIEDKNDTTPKKGNFIATFNKKMLVKFTDVLENTKNTTALLIDARSNGRFNGTEPEPRKDLRSGHIPKSINIPYESVLRHGKFKSSEELKRVFKVIEKEERPLVFSCGSGITACIILCASELINLPNKKAVFDGSWTEWALSVE